MDKDKARADQIQTLLAEGKTPQEIIARGYVKSTAYAVVKKAKPKLDLLPGEKLEERLRRLENFAMQLMSIVRVEDVISQCVICTLFVTLKNPMTRASIIIFIGPDQLEKARTTVDTLIHELAHHQSGEEDLTEGHSNAMTRVGARVVEFALGGEFDAELEGAVW